MPLRRKTNFAAIQLLCAMPRIQPGATVQIYAWRFTKEYAKEKHQGQWQSAKETGVVQKSTGKGMYLALYRPVGTTS